MTDSAYLLTPHDPYDEAQLLHPDGTRETIAATAWARPLGISLAMRGYLAPWPVEPRARYRLASLPESPCPAWCPGTPEAHHVEADTLARVYLEHARHIAAGPEASVIVRQTDLCHPLEVGTPVLAVLGDDLDHADALALAEAITTATAHLSEAPTPDLGTGSVADPVAAVVSRQDDGS